MATRSEQFHADEERRNNAKNKKRAKTKHATATKNRSRAKEHVAKNATYALELTRKGMRPSRKSSRKSANRAKSDTSFNMVEQLGKASPESRFRKERTHRIKVRGKSSTA